MGEREPAAADPADELLTLYDRAVGEVYGYVLPRCGSTTVAEDLTAETFLAAVTAVQKQSVERLTVAWLVGVARHKLVDHWRRLEREERKLELAHDQRGGTDDPWEQPLDVARAHEVLAALAGHHRSALALRYLDGLSVPDVAEHLGRTVHATEALLVRARGAFRKAYGQSEGSDGGD